MPRPSPLPRLRCVMVPCSCCSCYRCCYGSRPISHLLRRPWHLPFWYSLTSRTGCTLQYPYGVPYGTIWPYAGIYGGGWRRGREYSSRRWEDKAIFLQRELNDLQAERGLYERQLAVTAANIGLIKSGNAPSGASISAHPASTFAWFKGARPVASPPVPAVPFAGTAVPVMPAMPLAVAAATGTPTFPQAYSVARSTPSLMSVEEPLPTSEATAGLSSLAAGAPAQGAPAHLPRLQLMSVLARQEAAELAARGVDAAAQAQVRV